MEKLYISDNRVRDISPLRGLSLLKVLELQNNEISDLEPLASLTALEYLDVRENPVKGYSPVQSLDIETLYMDPVDSGSGNEAEPEKEVPADEGMDDEMNDMINEGMEGIA